MPLHVVGLDLSGPTNTNDTALTVFQAEGERLVRLRTLHGADDFAIIDAISAIDEEVLIAPDAPLSYNPGGGDRPADKALRQALKDVGLSSIAVMAPMAQHMVYLTLRGLAVARTLEMARPRAIRIVEVHPTASLALRGAPIDLVVRFKHDVEARPPLLQWLEGAGLQRITSAEPITDHYVASCAAALAAWCWHLGKPVWCTRADPPHHPYDFAC